MIAVIIQLILFTFYITFIWVKYGVQKSISETWYTLQVQDRWLFTIVFSFGVGICQLVHENVYFFISGVFLCLVGVSTDFRSYKLVTFLHYIGAIGTIIFSLLGLWILGIQETSFLVLAIWICLYKWENWIWWAEIATFYLIMGGILVNYIQ